MADFMADPEQPREVLRQALRLLGARKRAGGVLGYDPVDIEPLEEGAHGRQAAIHRRARILRLLKLA